jgi:nucleotide-binding universal stress UspA family protein
MSGTAQAVEKKLLGFKHILIATDFSPASERATECALAIARHYDSQLTLAHPLALEPREPIAMDSPRELDAERFKAEQRMRQFAENTARVASHAGCTSSGDAPGT